MQAGRRDDPALVRPRAGTWARRLLVVAWLSALSALVAVTWVGLPAWIQLLGLLAVIVSSLLLRRTTGEVEAAGYRSSYLLVAGLVVAALTAGWLAADAERVGWQPTADQILALLFGFTALSAALPSAVLAWGRPGESRRSGRGEQAAPGPGYRESEDKEV